MLSVGPGADRFSPSQNVPIKKRAPIKSVMYITDNTRWRGLQIPAGRRVTSLSGDVQGQPNNESEKASLRDTDSRAHNAMRGLG